MLDRSPFHKRFTDMLAGEDEGITTWLEDPTHIARLRVYRNNVTTAWADTIVKNFPTVEQLVGTEFMRGVAVAFVKYEPATDPVLSTYGDGFPEFLDTFKPARPLPYLPDVARLDRAWTEAFFAASASAMKVKVLAGRSEDEVSALELVLHPSLRLLPSRWNAWEIWKLNRAGHGETGLTLKEEPSWSAIWWSPEGLADQQLSEVEFTFLRRIGEGDNLRAAMSGAASEEDAARLYAFFSEALTKGMFQAALSN